MGDPFKDTSGPALNILIKLMSVISLVIAPALKAWQYDDATDGIIEWEPKSVAVGVGILVLMLIVLYAMQRYIDYGYGVKRSEVEASIQEQEVKDKKAHEAMVNANPAAFAALKTLNESKGNGALDMAAAEKLLEAMKNPVATVKQTPPAETVLVSVA